MPVLGNGVAGFYVIDSPSAAVEYIETNHVALSPLFPDDSWTDFEKPVQNYDFVGAETLLSRHGC